MVNYITTPFQLCDGYKLSHLKLHKKNTIGLYGNFTPRKSRREGINKYILFGLQAWLKDLNWAFDNLFFNLSEDEAVENFDKFYLSYFGNNDQEVSGKIRGLHKLGYLPLMIKALPEGSAVNHNIPCATLKSTSEEFCWFEQWVETWLSCTLWKPGTSAVTAGEYRKIFNKYNALTSDIDWIVDFQGHAFDLRGECGMEDGASTGAAHLIFFKGTDSCPALPWIDYHYAGDNGLVGTSVPASEHSIAQQYLNEVTNDTDASDRAYIQDVLDTFPTGIVSLVLDTYDFWHVVTNIIPDFKDQIMARDGKFVVRPDSSPKTPVEMIIGDSEAPEGTPENKGLVQCLYEIFGGTVNSKGFIDLDSHISGIYGDSITMWYADMILEGLMKKGFSSNNIVLGIGSGTYQGNGAGLHGESSGSWGISRDTHGIAIKATAVQDENGWRATYKDPKTDNSGKKSARGFLKVELENGEYVLHQDVTQSEEEEGALELVYLNGKICRHQSFADVRAVAQKFL